MNKIQSFIIAILFTIIICMIGYMIRNQSNREGCHRRYERTHTEQPQSYYQQNNYSQYPQENDYQAMKGCYMKCKRTGMPEDYCFNKCGY